jgi:hypothetical protein
VSNLSYLPIGIPSSGRLVYRNIHDQVVTAITPAGAGAGGGKQHTLYFTPVPSEPDAERRRREEAERDDDTIVLSDAAQTFLEKAQARRSGLDIPLKSEDIAAVQAAIAQQIALEQNAEIKRLIELQLLDENDERLILLIMASL